MQSLDECEFLGWAVIDLDDPAPKRAFKLCQQLGCPVEDFIEEAIIEKLRRMDEQGGIASLQHLRMKSLNQTATPAPNAVP